MNTTLVKSMRIAALIAVTFAASHASAADKVIAIDGSSTVYPITEAMAEEFQKIQKVKVTVGESGTGGVTIACPFWSRNPIPIGRV